MLSFFYLKHFNDWVNDIAVTSLNLYSLLVFVALGFARSMRCLTVGIPKSKLLYQFSVYRILFFENLYFVGFPFSVMGLSSGYDSRSAC